MTDRNYRIELIIDDGGDSRTVTCDTKDHKIWIDGGLYPRDLELVGALTKVLRLDQRHGPKANREGEDPDRFHDQHRGPLGKI